MPRVYTARSEATCSGDETQKANGYKARIQFTREEAYTDVVISSAFYQITGELSRGARIYVQTLEVDGTRIDSVEMVHNGIGGAHIGLYVLKVGLSKRFQVVVLAYKAGAIRGTLTAMHGITTETSALLKDSLDAAGSICVQFKPPEVVANGSCKVAKRARQDIVPLFSGGALNSKNYTGVVTSDFSSQGGSRVVR